MALKVLRDMPLSLVDFVGLEKELPQTNDPFDMLAFVCEFEGMKLKEIEKGIAKRKGWKGPRQKRFRKKMEKKEESSTVLKMPMIEQACVFTVANHPMVTRTSVRAAKGKCNVSAGVKLSFVRGGQTKTDELRAVQVTADALAGLVIEETSQACLLAGQVTDQETDMYRTDAEESHTGRKRPKKASKKPAKRVRVEVNNGPEPPPPLPDFFKQRIEAIGGVNPILVLQKGLYKTDLSQQHNRLSIPLRAVKDHSFLTEDEKAYIHGRGAKQSCQFIDTDFLDTNGEQWNMPLRVWEMAKPEGKNSSWMYALTDPWIKMARGGENDLVAGDVVQLWAFRVGVKLGLALVKLE